MGLMALAALAMVIMHAIVRHLSADLHPFEIAFFRNVFGLLFVLPLVAREGLQQLRPKRPLLLASRGIGDAAAMLCFFTALSIAPLATATALSFTAPLFATVLAIPLLREMVGVRRATSLAVGFIGAVIVVRPGAEGLISAGAALTLASAFFWGLVLCVIKVLSRNETSVAITFWAAVALLPATFLASLPVWRGPEWEHMGWLLLMGAVGTGAQYWLAEAMRRTDVTVVLPIDFTRLLWSAALGYLLFMEIPDAATLAGGSLIFASVIYNAYREQTRVRASLGAPER